MSPGASKETVLSQMGHTMDAFFSADSAAPALLLLAAILTRASQTLH